MRFEVKDLASLKEAVNIIDDGDRLSFHTIEGLIIAFRIDRQVILHELRGESTMPIEETLCPLCSSKMIPRNGQYGKFWGCSQYPNCKGTRDSMGRSKSDRVKEDVTENVDTPFRFERKRKVIDESSPD